MFLHDEVEFGGVHSDIRDIFYTRIRNHMRPDMCARDMENKIISPSI